MQTMRYYMKKKTTNDLIRQIDARGDTTTCEYDHLGRVTLKRYASTDPTTSPLTYTYTYDNSSSNNRGRGKLFKLLSIRLFKIPPFGRNEAQVLTKVQKQ